MSQGDTSTTGLSSKQAEQFERRWRAIRPRVQQRWQELSPNDLDSVQGDMQRLVALLHQRTSDQRGHIEAEIEAILSTSAGMSGDAERLQSTGETTPRTSIQQRMESVQNKLSERVAGLSQNVAGAPQKSLMAGFGVGAVVGFLAGLSMSRSSR